MTLAAKSAELVERLECMYTKCLCSLQARTVAARDYKLHTSEYLGI
jgi:hypothetical protein